SSIRADVGHQGETFEVNVGQAPCLKLQIDPDKLLKHVGRFFPVIRGILLQTMQDSIWNRSFQLKRPNPIKEVERKSAGVQPAVDSNPCSVVKSCKAIIVITLDLAIAESGNYGFCKLLIHA